ncbi:MAG TPA: nitrogen regulation protein NR(I) [Gammaproteobacteria bacterium]|nr:nitrogen regulation protein NR(I) [Gammaproteobacteria bacterium]
MAEIRVWVVEDDASMRWVLERALRAAGMHVSGYQDAAAAEEGLRRGPPDVVLTDIRMPGQDGLSLMQRLHEADPDLPVIVMTAHSDLDSAVASYRGGAFEYLPKPFDIDEAVALVRRAWKHRHRDAAAASEPDAATGAAPPALVGEAPAMQEVFRAIGRLTRSNITVLITGESGTGKELVARALHRHGPRAGKPFIAINTAAIPRELLESELFGHERGAFTGAQAQRRGRFEQADGGTLFLDEIGDMPAELQTRLLRVLSDGEFYRVGGHVPIRADVRIIAATHQDLEAAVAEGHFREDLYHRLNVIRVHLPALRERREDIPALLRHFLDAAARELDTEPKQLAPEVERYLQSLDWPGNVRQLENTCRWLTVMGSGRQIHLEDLPPELARHGAASGDGNADGWEAPLRRWAEQRLESGGSALLDEALPVFERVLIETALRRTRGHRQEAAELLGWGRNTLARKISQLGIDSRD